MSRRSTYIFLFISLVIGVLLWVLIPVALELLLHGKYKIEFLAGFIFIMFFPITFFSYQNSQRNVRLKQLTHDLQILGIREDNRAVPGNGTADDVYTRTHDNWRYIVHIVLLLLMVLLGLILLFGTIPVGSDKFFTVELLRAFQFSFVGSYLFSVQLIYRRYTTYDLEPSVYFYCWLNMLAGFVFSFVIFKPLSPDNVDSTGIEEGLRSITAFVLGYFPSLALQFLSSLAYRAVSTGQTRNNDMPLSLIDGLSELHLARLRDNAIDNMQNLASADIRKILVSTPFNAQQVIDWIDQAILYIHMDPGQIVNFRSASIRSISGFRNWWKDYSLPQSEGKVNEDIRRSMAQQVRSTPEQLDILYSLTEVGTNTHFVIPYWTNVKVFTSRIQEGYITTLPESLNNLLENLSRYSIQEIERDPRLREQIKRSKELTEQIEAVRGAITLTTAASHLGEALIYYMDAKYDLALVSINQGIQLDKSNLGLYRLMAQTFHATDRFTQDKVDQLAISLTEMEYFVISNPSLTEIYTKTIQLVLDHNQSLVPLPEHISELQRLQQINSVYISYRRDATATPIMLYFSRELQLMGFNILLGDDLIEKSIDPIDFHKPETEWVAFLDKNISNVTNYVFIVTDSFFASPYTSIEVEFAIKHGKVIIPIVTESATSELFDDNHPLGKYHTFTLNTRHPIEYRHILEQIYSKLLGRKQKLSENQQYSTDDVEHE